MGFKKTPNKSTGKCDHIGITGTFIRGATSPTLISDVKDLKQDPCIGKPSLCF